MARNERKSAKNKFFTSNKISHTKTSKLERLRTSSGTFSVTSSENNIDSLKYERRKSEHKPDNDKTICKKPFDKKKWRLKKYSKKYKLEQWENKRKKKILNEYYKELKDEVPKFDVKQIYEKYDDEEEENENNINKDLSSSNSTRSFKTIDRSIKGPKNKQTNTWKKTEDKIHGVQGKDKISDKDLTKRFAERDEARKQSKAQQLEKHKKLNMKTKKGQPIMKYRMEMLLEQIQKSMS